MKKFLISITIVLALGLGANAQIDMSDAFINDWETSNRLDMGGFSLMLPGSHGFADDISAPLGSGLLILGALGAGYTLKRKKSNHRALMALTLMMTLAFGQTAWAQTTTWTVGGTGNQFTITRSGDISREVTVYYRTVSLSAIAGQHYIEKTGSVTIPANQASAESISVSELNPSTDAYKYQTTTERTYRFEALDAGGFELAHRDRTMTSGIQFKGTYVNSSVTDLVYFDNSGNLMSGISSSKYLDVSHSASSGTWKKVTDGGYKQAVHTVSTNNLYGNSTNASTNILSLRSRMDDLGYKMYATVYFTQKEEQDGYQYIQILTDNATTYDDNDPNGKVNNPSTSKYKACFILSYDPSGSVMSDPHKQFFPHRYDYVDKAAEQAANITHYEFDYGNAHLYQQKFKSNNPSYQATNSGSLVLNTSVNNLNIRFDAAGSGGDDWDFKDLKVRLTLVDGTAPTVLNSSAIAVNPGNHCNGNDFYISVPFNEIVTIEGSTKKLTTSWGDATYFAGSGSNVLTFKGTINAEVNKALKITGKSGTIKDLAGNSFSGSLNKNFSATVEASYSFPITYTLNGGSFYYNAPTSYTYDDATQIFGPFRTGYDFAGWTGSNGNTPETTVTIPEHSHGDMFYTANWTPRTYTITYYLNGGEPTGSYPASYTIETPTFTIAVPTKTGYTFNDWVYNILDDDGRTYSGHVHGDITVAQGSNGSRTYQANWYENMYCIHYDANATNGIPAIGTMEDHYCFYNEHKTLRANAFSRTGYTFAGWNTEPDGSGTAFTDQQVVYHLTDQHNVTITLYAQWNVINWTGGGTSENDPYLIIYASQLVKLADDVNSGEHYWRKYFKLGNDIDMNGVAFEGIGSIFNQFSGYFNADNRTISNLTINSQEGNIGLFVYMTGSVSNLILSGANITGRYEIGGIAGRTSGSSSISNCLVLNSNITKTGIGSIDAGVIVGNNNTNAVLTNNHYRNCSVTQGENTYTTNIGTPNGDVPGARSVHTLTLPQHVTATGETVTYNQVTYYASNVQVTLTHDQGYKLTDVMVNGNPATTTDDGYTWSFTMPAADATVTCGNSVPYIDADGNLAFCTSFTVIESSQYTYGTNGQECWFVVSGDVTINGIFLKGTISHLILCDGATLTINQTNNNDGLQTSDNLIIYGQSVGNGTLTVSAPWIGLSTNNDLIINGGIISATSTTSNGITAGLGNITINRGSVTARGYYGGIYGQNIFINGGIVNATNGEGSNSYGIKADLNITLGYTELTDRITSSSYKSYNGTVSVKAGQFLTDGTTAAYIGTLNNDQISALAGQTLQPCFSLTLPEHVVATSGVISQSNGIFALPGASVVLEAAEGYALAEVTVNSIAATDNGDSTWSFSMPGANATVSATVSAITYNISYDLGGGSVATANPDTYTIESGAITLNNPSRTSFTFTGWNGTDLTEPTMSVTIPAGSTGDRSYGATWSPNIAQLWGSGDGSLNAPYIITSPEGLDLLATLVNEGNDYNDTYFELGDNIQYDHAVADNYTPIGFSEDKFFAGTFNGKGYTISGIRNTTELYIAHGLFGVSNGDIYNVVLEDVQFNLNNSFVGCVVGWNFQGSVHHCLVIDAVLSSSSPDIFIVGYNEMGIVDRNYYYNCTCYNTSGLHNCVTLRGDATTNVVFDSYTYGIVYNNVLYAPFNAGAGLILSYHGEVPAGYAPVFVPKDDYTTSFYSDSNIYYVYLGYDDVTITALLGKTDVPYIDADGVEQTCPVAIEIASNGGNNSVHYRGGWYVVNSNTNISNSIEFHDDAHLILSDNTGISSQGITGSKSLTIYAQSEGDARGVCQAPLSCGTLTINGGKFPMNISVNKGDLVINSGLVVVNSLSAQYEGIGSVCNITLGWRNSEKDYIHAYSYTCDGTIKIKDGQYFTNGPELVYGTITDMSKLNGKTLNPFQSSVEYFDANGVQQYCTDFTVIENGTDTYSSSSEGSWYVVYKYIDLDQISFSGGDTHIILMDGATLDLNYNNPSTSSYLKVFSGNLHIYGQFAGTGTIYGEYIADYGGDIVFNGGTLNVEIINTYEDIHINGGSITATVGIMTWGNIYLGWTKASDRITAGSYSYDVSGYVSVKDGQAFGDEDGKYYMGTLTFDQMQALSGKTLSPFSDFTQSFAINYHTKGGTLPSDYPTNYTFNTTVELPVPTLDDQFFYGWFEQDEIRGDSLVEITAGTRLGDIDLYAFWGPIHTNVTYIDENGDTQTAYATVLYGGADAEYPDGVYTLIQDALYKNLSFTGNTTLIIPDGMILNVAENDFKSGDVGTVSVDGDLTVYGQEDGDGKLAFLNMTAMGDVYIYGGLCFVYDKLTAKHITLSWAGRKTMIYAKEYEGTVSAAKSFAVYDLDEDTLTFIDAGEVSDHTIINEKALLPNAPTINVSYIDENGDMHTTEATVLWGNETDLPGGTYTVILGRDIFHGISFSGNTTIIIPDEYYLDFYANKNWEPLEGTAITVDGDLSVYGQMERKGYLNINATECIRATRDVIISNVSADLTGSSNGIVSGGNISIIDGECDVTGINANNGAGTITLGYLTNSYEIISSAYYGIVRIRDGQMLCKDYAPNLPYSGVLSSDQVNDILDDYLVPSYTQVTLDVEGYGDGDGKWVFIASPIVGSTRPDDVWYLVGRNISIGQYDYDLYRLNPSNAMWENHHQHGSQLHPFVLENGKGYLYARKEDVTLQFHGSFNMKNIQDVALERGTNLVGNPFTVPAYVNRPYYKMNDAGTDIEAVSTYTTTTIPACNGVVVRAAGDDEAVTFSTTAPELLNGDKGSLQMTLSQAVTTRDGMTIDSYQDKAIVSFNEGMQLGKYIFNEDHAKLYIPQNIDDYAIAYSDGKGEMPINFKANETGRYTIYVDKQDFASSQGVSLIDKFENVIVDLSVQDSYTFIGSPADRKDRFMLVFSPSTGSQEDVFAYQSGSGVTVTGNGELQVYDIMGRKVLTQYINGVQTVPTSSMQIGVYIFKMNDKWQKIVIK